MVGFAACAVARTCWEQKTEIYQNMHTSKKHQYILVCLMGSALFGVFPFSRGNRVVTLSRSEVVGGPMSSTAVGRPMSRPSKECDEEEWVKA